jgi:2-octaprenylphenol hydroxylase
MRYDVVIIGAGLVGQSLAAALAQGNPQLAIALVDPALASAAELPAVLPTEGLDGFDLRVSALTARSQNFLTDIGAWQWIRSQRCQPYTHMTVWDAEGTGEVNFDAADLHVPCLGHIVENRETLAGLRQQLASCPAVTQIAQPVQYLDSRQSDGLTPVVLAQGDTLLAALVVGADGAHSRVRQWVGLPTREWDYQHQALVATVAMEKPLAATAWQRFRPQGPLALLPMPTNPHLASIVWSTSDDEANALMALSDEAFGHALAEAFEQRLGTVTGCSQRAAIPLRQRHARCYWQDGVVLAGDAAHTIHPLAGQGVNLGFKDVEVLAAEVLTAVARGISPGHDQVLARYQRRRQADNLATMAAMEGFKRLFAADAPLVRLLRNVGMNRFDRLLPVKQHAMMQAMGL